MEIEELIREAKVSTDQNIKLLAEWFEYWYNSDEMPAKMPESLHIRTAVRLTEYQFKGR